MGIRGAQPSSLDSELGRPEVFRLGIRYLVGSEVFGTRLRLLYRLTLLERAPAGFVRRVRAGIRGAASS